MCFKRLLWSRNCLLVTVCFMFVFKPFFLQSMLQDEVKQLKLLVEQNPEVTKFAIDNLDLRGKF